MTFFTLMLSTKLFPPPPAHAARRFFGLCARASGARRLILSPALW
jgi:hypothetical protein